jgi:hypothetical protein
VTVCSNAYVKGIEPSYAAWEGVVTARYFKLLADLFSDYSLRSVVTGRHETVRIRTSAPAQLGDPDSLSVSVGGAGPREEDAREELAVLLLIEPRTLDVEEPEARNTAREGERVDGELGDRFVGPGIRLVVEDLANDSVTVAIEIPIWLTEEDIAALERQHGIELAPKTGSPRSITGHIDFLQVRNGARLARSPFVCRDAPLFFSTIYDKENWKCSKSGDAGVPGLRARQVRAQLGFGDVLELCGSESALPVLF